MKTNCIICSKEVENWDEAYPEGNVIHPIDGTVFKTYGHYGSTVFDPMDASFMEIVICCDCLKPRTQHTYISVDEEYKQQLDERRAESDLLLKHLNLLDLDDYDEMEVKLAVSEELEKNERKKAAEQMAKAYEENADRWAQKE